MRAKWKTEEAEQIGRQMMIICLNSKDMTAASEAAAVTFVMCVMSVVEAHRQKGTDVHTSDIIPSLIDHAIGLIHEGGVWIEVVNEPRN
jgi:hypothetical protein